jgi:hypothetical protein
MRLSAASTAPAMVARRCGYEQYEECCCCHAGRRERTTGQPPRCGCTLIGIGNQSLCSLVEAGILLHSLVTPILICWCQAGHTREPVSRFAQTEQASAPVASATWASLFRKAPGKTARGPIGKQGLSSNTLAATVPLGCRSWGASGRRHQREHIAAPATIKRNNGNSPDAKHANDGLGDPMMITTSRRTPPFQQVRSTRHRAPPWRRQD